jgi:hypothetical protein
VSARRRRGASPTQLSPSERYSIREVLRFGPWKLVSLDGEHTPGGPRRFDDDELERHWHGWAKQAPRSTNYPEWDETCWAVRRFELGEEAEAAFVACRRLDDAG